MLITISLINYACEKTPNSNGELKPRIDNNVEKVSVYPCNSTTCNDHIQCPNDPLCNFRKDLNPCDYANMEVYANVVACELTRLIKARRDCPIPAQYSPCEGNSRLEEQKYCIKDLYTPPALITLFGGQDISPWRYCGNSSCIPQPYECTNGTFIKWHHIFLSQAAQDILVDYILATVNQLQTDGLIGCTVGSSLKYREIKMRNCYDSPIPIICEPNSTICTNMSLTIQVTYGCCVQ
ncbi:MAG: hypothetical protein HOP11_03775 [Saprospiraceae bacterium]|nr:hypothetical protein [Saprospiraceae bacterium]